MDLVLASEYISDSVAIISLEGPVDVHTSVRARESFIAAANSGHYSLVIDMRRTEILDSTGLGVIVGAIKRCRVNDGGVAIIVGHLRILRVFEISGLYKFIRLFNDKTAAIEVMSSQNIGSADASGPHEYKPAKNRFTLELYTADFGESLRLRNSLIAVLKDFAIKPVFLLPDDNGCEIRECVLALSAPVSLKNQIHAVCNAIERHVNTVPAPDAMGDDTIRELVATLKETRDATIRLESAVIAYANNEIVTRIFDPNELRTFSWSYPLRNPKRIVSALKSTYAR